ncbi:hypothetical protein HDU93_006156 [Gonapodya sp. JEL0774]|nr:hypothetical protein HDU93_006156 [Gonapodya sp. JEL0774]
MTRLFVTGLTVNPSEAGNAAITKAYKLTVAFAYSLRHYLRGEHHPEDWKDMDDVMDVVPLPSNIPLLNLLRTNSALASDHIDLVVTAAHPVAQAAPATEDSNVDGKPVKVVKIFPHRMPFRILQALSKHFAYCLDQKLMNLGPYTNGCDGLISNIVDATTTLERIATTPIPPAYNIHLKQLLLAYCAFLPIQLSKDLGWWMILVVGLVSYCLLGIEMIAKQLEMPFGDDPNDLPLQLYCDVLKDELQRLIAAHVYEGRKVFGTITSQMRNIMRLTVTGVYLNKSPQGEEAIQKAFKLIVAFMHSLKHYLRAVNPTENDISTWEDFPEEFKSVIPPAIVTKVTSLQNGSAIELESESEARTVRGSNTGTSTGDLAFGASNASTALEVDPSNSPYPDKLPFRIAQALAKHNALNIAANIMPLLPYGSSTDSMITGLVDSATSLERIATSPIPKAYNIHLKQILLIYCFTLPIQLFQLLGWWMVLIVAITGYCLLGVEMIARQLEMPFGYDENDLPVDEFCEALQDELQKLVDDHANIA